MVEKFASRPTFLGIVDQHAGQNVGKHGILRRKNDRKWKRSDEGLILVEESVDIFQVRHHRTDILFAWCAQYRHDSQKLVIFILSGENWRAKQHLTEDTANAPNVQLDAVVDVSKQQLWRAVVAAHTTSRIRAKWLEFMVEEAAHKDANVLTSGVTSPSTVWIFHVLCVSEINDLHQAILAQHDISWLQVPVGDSFLVQVLECFEKLLQDVKRSLARYILVGLVYRFQ